MSKMTTLQNHAVLALLQVCAVHHCGLLKFLWNFYPFPSPSNRQHLSYDDCLDDKKEDYQKCSVLYYVLSCRHSYKQFQQVNHGLLV